MHGKFLLLLSISILFLFVSSCQRKPVPPTLFEKLSPSHTGIDFINKVENTDNFNIFSYRNFYNGGGVAIGDLNGDGLPEIFVSANMGSNKLYLNKGDFVFEDITESAGVGSEDFWSTGVSFVDINGDGLLDIYVCNAGYKKGMGLPKNQLFINKGDMTFVEMAAEYGLDDEGYSTHAVFFDYDGDGLLDCYILNNSFIPVNTLNYSNKRELRAQDWPVKDFLKGGGDKLLKNTGSFFVDVSEEAGIYGSLIGFGLGVTVGDVDNDGWPDIYVSNDFFERDYLYINNRNGTFSEVLTERMQHISLSSMGADMADINNDSWPEIFVTDMLPFDEYRLKTTTDFEKYDVHQLKVKQGFYEQYAHNTLQLNNKNGNFKQIAFHAGVAATDWSWGALMFDANSDGWQDILVCNGIFHDVIDQDFIDFFANDVVQRMVLSGKKETVDSIIQKMPSVPIQNFIFENKTDLSFVNRAIEWGLDDLTFSNGAAYGDLNGDGSLDLVINNVNQPLGIYKNNVNQQEDFSFISFDLKGPNNNRHCIGAQIWLYHGEMIQRRELIPNRGFQSSVDFKVIFGLKSLPEIDSIHIIWPDKTLSKFDPFEKNKHHVITYEHAIKSPYEPKVLSSSTLFQEIAAPFQPHKEDSFVDFDYERNLPMKLSKEGPCVIQIDINNDGKDDIILGGAKDQPTQVFITDENDSFQKWDAGDLTKYPEFEDTAICIMDANGDGFPDIFIGSGGNFQPSQTREMQDRLYINQKDGTFKLKTDAFPVNGMNTSVALSHDFNGDGIPDLFVGSRSLPQQYGILPRSYIYINDGTGKFTDATLELAPELTYLGMICDATICQLFGADTYQMIIVGEWFQPIIFEYDNKKWKSAYHELFKNMEGWWYSVHVQDLDHDGRPEIILGNRGSNAYLGSRDDMPIKLWVNDFSLNGYADKILSRSIAGKDVPVMMLKDFTKALPSIKKESLTHHQFASKDMTKLFSKDILKNSLVRQSNTFETTILWQTEEKKFIKGDLPLEIQLSSVSSIQTLDVNGDGMLDVVMGGNHFVYPPQFSRLEGSYGAVLLNKGNRNFAYIPSHESGIHIRGAIKHIQVIDRKNETLLLFAVNDEPYRLFKLIKQTSAE